MKSLKGLIRYVSCLLYIIQDLHLLRSSLETHLRILREWGSNPSCGCELCCIKKIIVSTTNSQFLYFKFLEKDKNKIFKTYILSIILIHIFIKKNIIYRFILNDI